MIKRKTCTVEGCKNPVWSKGKCKYHQDKPQITIEKDSKKTKERIELLEFFDSLWEKLKPSQRKCQVCGKHLGNTNLTIYHDHLLPKETYPQFKLSEKNMLLVCGDCHTAKTNGFPKAKHKKAIEKAKKELLK